MMDAEAADELKKRVLVCSRVKEIGYRGVDAILERLQGNYCVWSSIEDDVKDMVRDCLFCADYKTGGLVPRQLGNTVHGTQVSTVVHFDIREKTKDVVRREVLVKKRYTLAHNAFYAHSCRLIGPKGTTTSSDPKTRGYNAFRLLFSRWAIYGQRFTLTLAQDHVHLGHPGPSSSTIAALPCQWQKSSE